MRAMDTSNLILLNIGFAIHQADCNYKNVNSPFARIYLVKEGRAKLHLADRTQELSPGHLYLIPPFRLDISELLRQGSNDIEVLVYSTLSNHYQEVPSAYRGEPRAGLIGPVKLIWY
jgi:hypothetical protein